MWLLHDMGKFISGPLEPAASLKWWKRRITEKYPVECYTNIWKTCDVHRKPASRLLSGSNPEHVILWWDSSNLGRIIHIWQRGSALRHQSSGEQQPVGCAGRASNDLLFFMLLFTGRDANMYKINHWYDIIHTYSPWRKRMRVCSGIGHFSTTGNWTRIR